MLAEGTRLDIREMLYTIKLASTEFPLSSVYKIYKLNDGRVYIFVITFDVGGPPCHSIPRSMDHNAINYDIRLAYNTCIVHSKCIYTTCVEVTCKRFFTCPTHLVQLMWKFQLREHYTAFSIRWQYNRYLYIFSI